MLKNCTIFLVTAFCALSQVTKANIISRGDGVSVTGRLNQDGLSSTVIKTQQLNGPDLTQLTPGNNDPKNDDAHFRLFYKSNAPGRSVKHEMEHRFYKNPNFLLTPPREQQYHSYQGFNPLLNLLEQQQQQQQQQLLSTPYSNLVNLNSNVPNIASYNNKLENDRSTMFNLHYHDNYDYAPSDQLLQQQQQQQQQQYEQARKASLLKLMLANFVSAQQQQQQRLFPKPPTQHQPRNNNGVQYKIVNLKFRIEPQQGKLVGQGIVGTNNGAGSILNSQHFSLFPSELPALVKSILNQAQVSQHEQPQQAAHHVKGSFSYGQGFLKKKRDDSEAVTEDSNGESVEKREDVEDVEGSERKRRSSEDENMLTNESDERERRDDDGEEESEEKVNDNEFQESFKSLQRRDDEAEGGDDVGDRQERKYEEVEEAVPISERDLNEGDGVEEEQNY